MEWKDDIGSYFEKNGIYRLDYLNKLLLEYCEEWIRYLNSFSGIVAKQDSFTHPEYLISVKKGYNYPFKVIIHFKLIASGDKCCLYIKYTKSLSGIKKIMKLDEKDEGFYQWGEEEITEPEMVEKGYILQLLNNRFKDYDKRMS